jgi:hypothetical protein
MLLVPGIDPLLNLLVRDAFAALKGDGPSDAGNPPFIRIEIVVERLGGEEGVGAPSTLGPCYQPPACSMPRRENAPVI